PALGSVARGGRLLRSIDAHVAAGTFVRVALDWDDARASHTRPVSNDLGRRLACWVAGPWRVHRAGWPGARVDVVSSRAAEVPSSVHDWNGRRWSRDSPELPLASRRSRVFRLRVFDLRRRAHLHGASVRWRGVAAGEIVAVLACRLGPAGRRKPFEAQTRAP